MAAPERRLTFGEVAEVYEQVRPSYPSQLVDEVLAFADLQPPGRILEVGAGTGKATRQFAAGGFTLVALEPIPAMAAVARTTCRRFASVTIEEAEFEGWRLPPVAFKLVISAQAWHWIDPHVRYVKARAALSEGGALAAFWNHADWATAAPREVIEDAYRQAAPEFEPSGPMHPLIREGDWAPAWQAEIDAAPGFAQPEVRTYPWRQRYTAAEYVRVLSTHSDHIVLDPRVREQLFKRIEEAIAANGGELDLPYLTRLCLARAV